MGGEPPVGAADQPPAALMHRPVMGPAQQGEVRQIRRATIYPVPQMMGIAPGQGPIAAREDTAPVAHRQGGPLGRLDDPGGPPDLQRLGDGPAPGRGNKAIAARSCCWSPSRSLGGRADPGLAVRGSSGAWMSGLAAWASG